MDAQWSKEVSQVERQDLVMFINACLSCTRQREFYSNHYGTGVSLDFLHDYILGNYRLLYARTLAAGINHFNRAQIILKLLATGRDTSPEHRQEEGALIAAALNQLPPQRAWKVLAEIRRRGINNRRSRAVVRDYIQSRRDISFQAVKYRAKLRAVAIHNHLKLERELAAFLFDPTKIKAYQTAIFEDFRKAKYDREAIYALPVTVAEGFAAQHGIKREIFLDRIQQQMTPGEKLRLQKTANRGKQEIAVDLAQMPLTKLALYVLSLSRAERGDRFAILDDALDSAARRTLQRSPLHLGRVATVLDCSYSTSGSSEKRRRPLGIALAAHYLLKAAAQEYRAFWTVPQPEALLVTPRGQTDLATPVLDALEWGADLVAIVSDGWENDPPGGAAQVLEIYRTKLDVQGQTAIVHCNPVFDSDDFLLRSLTPAIPTVGLREAEDLPTLLGFARFAEGAAELADLEAYLAAKVRQLLGEEQDG
ncbi:hypothetical protein [Laspinema olomoucense]|uniref:TROVE domain-containing protein n=1 Tax=Laspinema olomoucense D3b TaxID=2953688 RepID=A0ABT2NDQ6_9CYAN|nr:hypothetical protein [Laspinema sp. D3b]MCT7980829.1 hypothetical protein [Laspinema sp. D3b]